jgi:protein AATF/BFR2
MFMQPGRFAQRKTLNCEDRLEKPRKIQAGVKKMTKMAHRDKKEKVQRKAKLEDFDPENAYFGDADNTAARLGKKKGAASAENDKSRDHYGDLIGKGKKKSSNEEEFANSKYAGKKSSRDKLGFEKGNSESDQEDFGSEEFDEDEIGSDSDFGRELGEDFDSEDLEEDYEEDDEGEDFDHLGSDEEGLSLSENDEGEDDRIPADYFRADDGDERARMMEELKRMQLEEDAQIELIAKKQISDADRGQHVKNQYGVWDQILDVRVQMQPLLTAANRLPSAVETLALAEAAPELQEEAIKGLGTVIDGLLDLQESLMNQDKIKFKKSNKKRKSCDLEADPEAFLQACWKDSCNLEAKLLPFCKDSLEMWHQRIVHGSELGSAKRQLKAIHQSPWLQVESALRDRERLLGRTQILRSGQQRIACPEDLNEDLEGNKNSFPDIFDDTDFYQNLLREWMETRQIGNNSAAVDGIHVKGISRGKDAAAKKKVHSKATKGRMLRYDVHDKLINYMVPMHCGPVPWNDEKISELFSSILSN